MSEIVVTYIRSAVGRDWRQKRTIRALGLRRLNQRVVKPDHPSVWGMIAKVEHLVTVERVASGAGAPGAPEGFQE